MHHASSRYSDALYATLANGINGDDIEDIKYGNQTFGWKGRVIWIVHAISYMRVDAVVVVMADVCSLIKLRHHGLLLRGGEIDNFHDTEC